MIKRPCHRLRCTHATSAAKCFHSNINSLSIGAITMNASRSFVRCAARHSPVRWSWHITAKRTMATKCSRATFATTYLRTMPAWSGTWNVIPRTRYFVRRLRMITRISHILLLTATIIHFSHSVAPCAKRHLHARSISIIIFDLILAKLRFGIALSPLPGSWRVMSLV